MKYRYAGKEKRLALGVFPEVSLVDARDAADKARVLLRDGVDPSEKRKADGLARHLSFATSLEAVGREWLAVITIPPEAAHQSIPYPCEVHGQQMSGTLSVTNPVQLQSFDID